MNTTNIGWSDNSTKPLYDLAVVIGRFQPFHNGHLSVLKNASIIAKRVLVLVGSSSIARNIKNPFTYDERSEMIGAVCEEFSFKNILTEPLVDDMYNNQQRIAAVQNKVYNMVGPEGSVVLVGHHSDDSSWYLDVFPKYAQFEVSQTETMHSTQIRDIFYNHGMIPKDVMPKSVEHWLRDFQTLWGQKEYKNLCEEYEFTKDYKVKHKYVGNLPYDAVFTTTDAVVINSGHILLVKRRMAPGKGLWALPGGFLGANERLEDSMLRELEEETRIKVSKDLLRASIKGNHVFDHPARSTRGRTITHAYLIVLNELKNPRVRGSDDAERAKWVPISEFYGMSEEMFEDHYSIGSYMINRAD